MAGFKFDEEYFQQELPGEIVDRENELLAWESLCQSAPTDSDLEEIVVDALERRRQAEKEQ